MREEADKRLTRTHAPLIQTWSITQRIWKLRESLKSSLTTCPLQLSERSCRSCEQRERHFSVSIILNCRRDADLSFYTPRIELGGYRRANLCRSFVESAFGANGGL